MRIFRNVVIEGLNKKPILTDIGFLKNNKPKPIIIFLHGFKGFKDWGHFNSVMNFFIQQKFVFITIFSPWARGRLPRSTRCASAA